MDIANISFFFVIAAGPYVSCISYLFTLRLNRLYNKPRHKHHIHIHTTNNPYVLIHLYNITVPSHPRKWPDLRLGPDPRRRFRQPRRGLHRREDPGLL